MRENLKLQVKSIRCSCAVRQLFLQDFVDIMNVPEATI